MISLRPYQSSAVENVRTLLRANRKRVLLVAPTGSGKCLGIGTPVLKFDGSIVPVESVEPGDLIMGPDSTPRKVLSTTRGTGELYRIVPVKGEPWVCNDVHVLTLVRTQDGTEHANKIIDIDLQSYLKSSRTFKHIHKQFTPESGVDFPSQSKPLPIDPYFLGVWYGDGTKRLNGIGISKPDPEILALCEETAKTWGLHIRTDYGTGGCPTHHLANDRGEGNPLLRCLREVVGDLSSFPREYLTSSRENRMAFLAGILDTDGYMYVNGFEIVQKRKGFADGIAFLARSLGMRALISEKIVNGQSYWRCSLSGDFSVLPMRIRRKQASERQQKKCATRTGFSVEPIGVGEYAGFELDGDGRFLLGDFTVTHNTVIAVYIILSAILKRSKVLFLAHRRELIRQTFCKLVQMGIRPEDIGIQMAGVRFSKRPHAGPIPTDPEELWRQCARWRPDAPVQVASIDTLRGRKLPPADLVIIDEAHRALSPSYVKLSEQYPNAVHLGLTATPWRGDGRGMCELYEELVSVASPRQLIQMGFLVEPSCFTVPAKDLPDLSRIKIARGDYDETQLAAAVDQSGLVGNIVEHWEKLSDRRKTVVFATSVEHSHHLTDRFCERGHRFAHLDGTTPTSVRDKILERLDRGEIEGVVNCDVLSEGWDMPSVKCCVLAKPTKSLTKFIQKAGRILRPFEGQTAIILDHAGCILEHGLPQEDREYSLKAREKKSKAAGGPRAKTCPECFALLATAVRVCPECQHEFEFGKDEEKKLEEKDGQLVQVREATQEEKKAVWDQLCHTAIERGFQIGWAKYKYKERFKVWPPNTFGVPEHERPNYSDEEKSDELRKLIQIGKDRGYDAFWAIKRYTVKFGHAPPMAQAGAEARG